MKEDVCLFCSIVGGKESAEVVLDLEDFFVIKNKYPTAPVHLLVLDKQHRTKSDTIASAFDDWAYWGKFFNAVSIAIEKVGLDKEGDYELVINGPSYAHFQHQHVHIMGAYTDKKGART